MLSQVGRRGIGESRNHRHAVNREMYWSWQVMVCIDLWSILEIALLGKK